MSTPRTTLLTALFLTFALALAPAANAGWVHQANSVFAAEKEVQKQPGLVEHTLVLPRTAENGLACMAYANNTTEKPKGKIVTRVFKEKNNGELEKIKQFAVTLNGKAALKCAPLAKTAAGKVLVFRHTLKKVARLRILNDTRQKAVISSVVTTVGVPVMVEGPLALLPKKGGQPHGLLEGDRKGWFHSANSVYHAVQGSGNVDHAAKMTHAMVLPSDTGASPLVCAGYNRPTDMGGKGRGRTKVKIAREGSRVEKMTLTGNVQDGSYLACKKANKKIRQGDVVSFESTYEGMPKLSPGTFSDLIGAVSASGRPAFGPGPEIIVEEPPIEEAEEEPEDKGDSDNNGGGNNNNNGNNNPPPPPPPPPPPSGGGLSVADEYAWTRVMDGTKAQITRPKGGSPGKFGVWGGGTAGYGDTIASALRDWERKARRSWGGNPRRLSSGERSDVLYFSRINPSGGPTAIRKGSKSSEFHADAYRPKLGAVKSGKVGSLSAAVRYLKSIGL